MKTEMSLLHNIASSLGSVRSLKKKSNVWKYIGVECNIETNTNTRTHTHSQVPARNKGNRHINWYVINICYQFLPCRRFGYRLNSIENCDFFDIQCGTCYTLIIDLLCCLYCCSVTCVICISLLLNNDCHCYVSFLSHLMR